jgi:hypothetical protein
MNPPGIAAPTAAPRANGPAGQAGPGRGPGSQDPLPGVPLRMQAGEAEREAGATHSRGGVTGGPAAGALVRVSTAGPASTLLGRTLDALGPVFRTVPPWAPR